MRNLIFISLLFITNLTHAQEFKLSGLILNEKSKPLEDVTIAVDGQSTKSSSIGFYEIGLTKGNYTVRYSKIGYTPIIQNINIHKNTRNNVTLTPSNINIDEVFVTAQESKSLSTSSIITKEAMQFLQPSSFTDLLELLPGGRAQDPNLTSFNSIKLREVHLKSKTNTSDKYNMSSLGVAFYIDGAPINTNSDLQSLSGYSTNIGNNTTRDNTNKGLDLRTLGTDDIEKVTIVRGIPSVEYGDLTSGLVMIERKKGYTPYTFRAKADGFGKLFSLVKDMH